MGERGWQELERLAGQLLVGGFEGTTIPDEFREAVRAGRVGGAILFKRNFASLEGVAQLIRDLRALPAPSPLWISIDQEGGRVQRLGAPFPQLPPMRQLGRAPDGLALVRAAAKALAESLKLLGVHQDYAPVLDVDTNPANPVIGDRAFSNEADQVAKLGAAFITALEQHGIASCGKHFPGHGDTSQDSHLELPTLPHSPARLEAVELAPFRAACAANVASIMTAHVLFPALDASHPATLSSKIIGPILRDQMHYDGVIVSDDLEMKAVADHYGIADSSVRALNAGCDQLLICQHVSLQAQAVDAIVHAVEGGQLSRARLEEAAARVARMKARFVQPFSPLPADRLLVELAAHSAALPSALRAEVKLA